MKTVFVNSYTLAILVIVIIITSCNPYKDLPRGHSYISFLSYYDKDTLTVEINDSLVFKNHRIEMIPQLNISKKSTILLRGKEFRIKGSFSTNNPYDILNQDQIDRLLLFDTIIYSKKGRFIEVKADYNKIIINQYKKTPIKE